MAAPNQQFVLGTASLNGADGDTLRQAAEKYNAHTHQTASAQAAIDGASAPSGSNVFATMADVGSGQLTTSEVEAIQAANSPSQSNPVATMSDIPSAQLTADELAAIQAGNGLSGTNAVASMTDIPGPQLTTDEVSAIQGASTPSGANVFATMSDLPSPGGFAFPPWDWAAGTDGFGVGASDFSTPVDLATLDSGRALGSSGRSADNKQIWLRPSAGDLATTASGLVIASIEAGDMCWGIRVIPRMTATAAANANPATTLRVQLGLALFKEANLSGGWNGVLLHGSGATASGFAIANSSGASRAASSVATSTGAGSWMLGQPVDFFIKTTGSQVEMAYGSSGAVQRFATVDRSFSGAGVLGVIAATETAQQLDLIVVRAKSMTDFPTTPA